VGEGTASGRSFGKEEGGNKRSDPHPGGTVHPRLAGPTQANTPSPEPDQPRPMGTAPGSSPFRRILSSVSFPSCYFQRSFPCLPPRAGPAAAPAPALCPDAAHRSQIKDKRGKRSGAMESTTPPGCLHGKPATARRPGGSRFAAIGGRWSDSAGALRVGDAGAAQPLSGSTSPPRRLKNTFQGTESIQEFLVLLRVHRRAEPTPLLSWAASGPQPPSPARQHRRPRRRRPLTTREPGCGTALVFPYLMKGIKKPPMAQATLPFLQMSPALPASAPRRQGSRHPSPHRHAGGLGDCMSQGYFQQGARSRELGGEGGKKPTQL